MNVLSYIGGGNSAFWITYMVTPNNIKQVIRETEELINQTGDQRKVSRLMSDLKCWYAIKLLFESAEKTKR